ncbi:RAN GTPase-activating protein [Arachis hypogaea]|nr:RAN GTPase-activating protein [Arachis hypogaea]
MEYWAFVDTEEAAELLEPLRAPSSYTKICFSNRSLAWKLLKPEAEALEVMTIFSCALEGCVLSCSSTRVGSDGGVVLAEALGTCKHLKKLDLCDNMFGVDDGAESPANALKESAPSLEVLDMAGNDITANVASSLVACVSSKQFLAKLNLSENELKDEGAILIGKALEEGHGQLLEVDLSTNSITRSRARALAEAVVQKPGFKLLNINANFISDEGIEELKDMFKNSLDMLGALDENDPEGEDIDEEAEEDADRDELESKLKGLEI